MTAAAVLAQMLDEGFDVALAANDALAVRPGSRLTDRHRMLLRSHKPEIVELLREAHETTQALLAAAMRACDHHGDGDTARQQMRADVLGTPPELRADLLDHFQRTYGAKHD